MFVNVYKSIKLISINGLFSVRPKKRPSFHPDRIPESAVDREMSAPSF